MFSEKLFLKNFCKQLFCIICTCNFLSQVFNENFVNFITNSHENIVACITFLQKLFTTKKLESKLYRSVQQSCTSIFLCTKNSKGQPRCFTEHPTGAELELPPTAARNGRSPSRLPTASLRRARHCVVVPEALRRLSAVPVEGKLEGDQRVDVDCVMR